MSKENTPIRNIDFQLIGEYYAAMERQGPGSPETTLKALSFIDKLPADAHIADLGSGTGSQTMVLAQHTAGQITALDLFPVFIDQLKARASELKLQDRINGVVGSMDQLPFTQESLDLIWSEGAIYNIGYERGLKEWRPYLKSGGYLAVSEVCWFTEERPEEIEKFWQADYPEIDTIARKISQMQKAGYLPVASFILPENCWTDQYYAPQAAVQEAFLKKHAGNPAAEAFVADARREAALYEKYKAYYGYAFFVGRKQ
jgi:ubiquinone/menaquinone biosynthesis C-methylase UbiE